MTSNKNLNQLKIAFCEKQRTNKWLAQQLSVNYMTVSKWYTYKTRLNLYIIAKIFQFLQMDRHKLLQPSNS